MTDLKQLSDEDLVNSMAEYYVGAKRELKRRLSERNQWQPIETAPRDGTEILACDKNGIKAIIAFLKEGKTLFGKIFSISMENRALESSYCAVIWTPIPQPPKED